MIALSKLQKRQVVLLARRAWRQHCAYLRADTGPGAPLPEFDTWRHDHVHRACGKLGLRLCIQSDYPAVMAHFLHLLGEDGAALEWMMRANQDPRQQAWIALEYFIRKWRLPCDYVSNTCRAICRCDLEHATAPQIWRIRAYLKRQLLRR